MAESFRPKSNIGPVGFAGKLKFYGRLVLDFQTLTSLRILKRVLPSYTGNVLDVGCGQSPYKFLLKAGQTKYYGIDIPDAGKFDYNNPEVTAFNGEDIPFEDEKFDAFLCTEVLEHVQHYQKLIDEMYRVTKKGGAGLITIPWSARYHYIPYDYFRYTPSSLKTMFSNFSEVTIIPRGTDITSIANKLTVLWFRNVLPSTPWKWLLVPVWLLFSFIPVWAICVAHVALLLNLGSDDDPLGYTIIVKK